MFRFPFMDKLSCWQKILQRKQPSKVDATASGSSHSRENRSTNFKMTKVPRNKAKQQQTSFTDGSEGEIAQKQGTSSTATPPVGVKDTK